MSYPVLWPDYLTFIPANGPDETFWPTLVVLCNVVLPIGMVSLAPLLPVVRTERP